MTDREQAADDMGERLHALPPVTRLTGFTGAPTPRERAALLAERFGGPGVSPARPAPMTLVTMRTPRP